MEIFTTRLFRVIAFLSIFILVMLCFFLVREGLPILDHLGIREFIFGEYWYPTDDPPDFGIFPLIAGSFYVTLLSALMAVPLGIMTAVYLSEIASPLVSEICKPVVELMAAMPSVVVGFFGMVVVAPFLQEQFSLPIGLNLFNASLMLAFMSVPTICSMAEDALHAVPSALREASLALGATELETTVRVVLPASLSGIVTAVILGMSRAIGETMVVLMVAGGAAMVPGSIFDPVRPMPANIAAEMAEAPFRSPHYHALFAVGMVLLLFTLAFNLVADRVAHRMKRQGGK